ncbi:hypothetical protein SISNIDRAFT_416843, partial [Sistotremastrum niveocremeum HHB9708]
IRTVAFYLDAMTAVLPAFRGSPVQVGLEPVIAAALPLVGPFIGGIMGLYVILLCCLFGISGDLIARMAILNLIIDCYAGFIPVIGTVIDVAFKCNLANLAILESHLKKSRWAMITIPPPRRWFDWTPLVRKDTRGETMKGF